MATKAQQELYKALREGRWSEAAGLTADCNTLATSYLDACRELDECWADPGGYPYGACRALARTVHVLEGELLAAGCPVPEYDPGA